MAFDGAGNYSLPPGSIVSDGTTIDASDHNVPVTDIAAAMSQVLLRSGVAPMTGNLNMGGFSVTNVGGTNPVLTGDNIWTGANTWSGTNIMTTVTSSGVPLELMSTNDDAAAGPVLSIYRNSATPANGDQNGAIVFNGKDSVGTKTAYSTILSYAYETTDGLEQSELQFYNMNSGSVGPARMIVGGGIYHASATGGDKGANTINFGAVYQNGSGVGVLNQSNNWIVTQNSVPAANLHGWIFSRPTTYNTAALYIDNTGGDAFGRIQAYFLNNGTPVGSILANLALGSGTTEYKTSSDERLKRAITPLADSGAIIDQLAPIRYRWMRDDGPEDFGFSAQALHAVVPQAATPGKGNPGDKDFVPWMIEHGRLEAILVAEIKALRARVAALEEAAGI